MKEVIKPWGKFQEIFSGGGFTVKLLYVKAGEALSLQMHSKRSEQWFVLSGEGTFEVGFRREMYWPGTQTAVPVFDWHRISATTDSVILEVASGEFDEEDIVRIVDKYGRVKP